LEAIIGIIIVFWVLISLFGGGKSQQGQRPMRRMPGMPPFTGGPGLPRPPLQRTQRKPAVQRERRGGTGGEAFPSAGMDEPVQPVYTASQPEQDSRTHPLSGEVYRSKLGTYEPENSTSGEDASEPYTTYLSVPDSDRLTGAAASASRKSVQAAGDLPLEGNRAAPNQNDVLSGIIWSEILGPPKSRRRIR